MAPTYEMWLLKRLWFPPDFISVANCQTVACLQSKITEMLLTRMTLIKQSGKSPKLRNWKENSSIKNSEKVIAAAADWQYANASID